MSNVNSRTVSERLPADSTAVSGRCTWAIKASIIPVNGLARVNYYVCPGKIIGSLTTPITLGVQRGAACVNAFAAGAILTMLVNSMMPEAFEHGGKLAGLMTVLGFSTAVLVALLEKA